MSTTTIRPLAVIDFEVDQVSPLAKAELALDAIGYTNNPFTGNVAKLQQLEAQREQAALREHGERLAAALEQRAALRAEIVRLEDDQKRWTEQLADLEREPVVIKWRNAQTIANARGFGAHFQQYAGWYVSDRSEVSRASNYLYYPVDTWPEQCRFNNDSDRDVVRRFREAEHRAKVVLPPALFEAKRQIDQLAAAHPEIKSVP